MIGELLCPFVEHGQLRNVPGQCFRQNHQIPLGITRCQATRMVDPLTSANCLTSFKSV